MGIPLPATLATAINALVQTAPMPLPLPRPGTTSGPMDGAGVGMGADSGLGSLPRDRSRERERACKCPPEKGAKVKKNHSMNPEPRRYQARITGFEYGITTDGKGHETNKGWNMEWAWQPSGEPEPMNFDGFVKAQCLLQETKGNYDQLLEKFFDENGDPKYNFDGFTTTKNQIFKQGRVVRQNPPTRLMWYFQTPEARAYLMDTLTRAGVPSVYQP
ncbi:restriction endonuclease fold toxin 5 domain-containing protein [Paraburkholderia sp. MMS20-SJTN17]|uniref:Restriction endonuclease fold toxin 5 domain-containing protein n=1 Tax=Paraburkholderia translucens TaxID=2886945 RepID=A0ABS8KCQ9_9BURK|nr:Tox-REase-5 domain-containing protein [Paraburkholderia sp. MMS20-SJTN17]MCC8402239.1 restriction endonuclease fold toxin 5 domain-containing protein [Paraburkholderia sp. MMS20-SJTN17]